MTEQFQSDYHRNYKGVIRWKNTSGFPVPPYAIVEAESFDEVNLTYNVIKPTGSGEIVFINGATEVPPNSYGTTPVWDGNAILAQFESIDHEFGTGADVVPDQWFLGEGDRFTLVSNVYSNGNLKIGSVLNNGGGGSSGTVMFEVSAVDLLCKSYITGLVVGGPCSAPPAAGDSLTIWDDAGCFLDLPDDELTALVGVRGFATKMKFVEEAGTPNPACPEKELCRWVITQICCPDPI